MSAATLTVVQAGVHTTVQDAGRWGFQHLGVPVGGALDPDAYHRANVLVGNGAGEAVLEVTLTGCALRTGADTWLAVTGAPFEGDLLDPAGKPASRLVMDTAFRLPAGATLVMGQRLAGARAYVGVRGGLDVPPVLGSRSAWPWLPRRGALRDGQVLRVADRAVSPVMEVGVPGLPRTDVLRVHPTADGLRDARVLDALCASRGYRIAATASRMAYPLEDGSSVPLHAPDRASAGTVNGAIQIVPSGLPILLMAERQTTGGYPIAAVVIGQDLSQAAQLPPGARVRFARCGPGDVPHAFARLGHSHDG